ncbi:MAG: Tn3 family transposase, partial [Chloroflexi bacterium]|nr:Tn3 family transposase [Chloroflexota bacterium]
MSLADAVVETHDRIVGRTYRAAVRTCEAQLGDETAAVREALRSFADLGSALINAKDRGAALDVVIANRPGWEGLGDLVATAAALANTVASDPLNHVLAGYSRFRRYTPRMLRTLDIEASPVARPLLEAVDVLRNDATPRPTGFLRPNSKWSRLLRTQPDHRLWETAVLFHLRDAFRAGDLWLARSRRYGDIRKTLLSVPTVADADRSLPVPVSPQDWLAERKFALDEGLRRLDAAARAGAIAGASIDEGMLRIERTEAAVPDGAGDLVTDLYQRIPDTRITDILLEVDDATRFTEAFTHLRTGAPCRDRIGLLYVLLAEGINLGLRKMAEATTTHGFWELMRIARWHVEGEAYDRALAVVVEAQAALPMAAFWGPGRTASSDGQFFPAAGRGEALNLVNARYGTEPGVKAYSHVSDRFSPFATQTIPATVHEAPYILDGLLMNETGRRIREQYADTGGFTDHVFAACSVLGYAFVPRIRDLPSKRLYVFERAGVPKRLRPLVGGKVNVDLIA